MKVSKWMWADALLLLAAAIWGGGFVAQRLGMNSMGPLAFGGVRFILGALFLLPLVLMRHRKAFTPSVCRQGFLLGLALFAAATCQQVGLVTTSAGKGGFLTGFYVVLVPLLGFAWARMSRGTKPRVARSPRVFLVEWASTLLAIAGIYFLSIEPGRVTMETGDAWVTAGAFLWALHILLLDNFTRTSEPVLLAWFQFVVCGVLSLALAFLGESPSWASLEASWGPLLYGGVVSVGVAYTLQVVAQRFAPPVHAAILLSLESVFAALAGWLMLGESLSSRALLGCALILGAALSSQLAQGFNQSTD